MSVKHDCSKNSPRAYDDVRGLPALVRTQRRNRITERGLDLIEVEDSLHVDFEEMTDAREFISSRRGTGEDE